MYQFYLKPCWEEYMARLADLYSKLFNLRAWLIQENLLKCPVFSGFVYQALEIGFVIIIISQKKKKKLSFSSCNTIPFIHADLTPKLTLYIFKWIIKQVAVIHAIGLFTILSLQHTNKNVHNFLFYSPFLLIFVSCSC